MTIYYFEVSIHGVTVISVPSSASKCSSSPFPPESNTQKRSKKLQQHNLRVTYPTVQRGNHGLSLQYSIYLNSNQRRAGMKTEIMMPMEFHTCSSVKGIAEKHTHTLGTQKVRPTSA